MKLRKSRWFFPTVVAAAAVAFVVVADRLVLPLHTRGHAHALTSWINGVARLVELPGMLVAEKLGLRVGHRTGWVAWGVIVALTGPFCFLAVVVLRRIWCGPRLTTTGEDAPEREGAETPAELEQPVPTTSRRTFLRMGGRAVIVGAAAVGGYAFVVERRRVEVTRRAIAIRGLPPSLDGFTITQLTDIHLGPWTSLETVRDVVRTTNGLGADLVALTGDYVHYSSEYIAPVMAELAALRGRAGVVATLGNHDWWEDGWMTLRELGRAGISIVDNGRLFVSPDRRLVENVSDGRAGLCVAGVGDLWEGTPNYDAALGGVPEAMPRVLLSHNPDVAEEPKFLRGGHRVDLMLSGHTHGGQIRVPGLGTPMIPSRYGQKYASGLVQGPACPVYVCRGIGTTIMPLRLGVPPEIAVIELRVG